MNFVFDVTSRVSVINKIHWFSVINAIFVPGGILRTFGLEKLEWCRYRWWKSEGVYLFPQKTRTRQTDRWTEGRTDGHRTLWRASRGKSCWIWSVLVQKKLRWCRLFWLTLYNLIVQCFVASSVVHGCSNMYLCTGNFCWKMQFVAVVNSTIHAMFLACSQELAAAASVVYYMESNRKFQQNELKVNRWAW